jgi:DNA-binding response OmpR family regulator
MESVLRHIQGHAAAHDLSTKLLIVDDDELELALMADRLTGVGLQVVTASNGVEALEILDREWFPVVLTDWRMPVMDGMQLIESLRRKGGEEIYIIMLSAQSAAADVERGYFNGVDDYLSKKSPDAELLARIEAAFNTVILRRSLKQVRVALAAALQVNSEMLGSEGQRATIMRLQAEMARAKRYHRLLSMIVVRGRTQPASAQAEAPPIDENLWRVLTDRLSVAIRIQVDWVGMLDPVDGVSSLAIVLPETGADSVAVVEHRILVNLLRVMAEAPASEVRLQFEIGAISLETFDNAAWPDTQQFLAAAKANAGSPVVVQPGVAIDVAALRGKDEEAMLDPVAESDAWRRVHS